MFSIIRSQFGYIATHLFHKVQNRFEFTRLLLLTWLLLLVQLLEKVRLLASSLSRSQGSVYIFREVSNEIWTQTAILIANDGHPGDLFGFEIIFSSGKLYVGAPGRNHTVNRKTFYCPVMIWDSTCWRSLCFPRD
jgi:hypothetical protein